MKNDNFNNHVTRNVVSKLIWQQVGNHLKVYRETTCPLKQEDIASRREKGKAAVYNDMIGETCASIPMAEKSAGQKYTGSRTGL